MEEHPYYLEIAIPASNRVCVDQLADGVRVTEQKNVKGEPATGRWWKAKHVQNVYKSGVFVGIRLTQVTDAWQ